MEQLSRIPRLAVLGVLDLQPTFRFVLAVTPRGVFGDDALEVLPAYLRKQVPAVSLDVLSVKDGARLLGHDRAQELPPLDKWYPSHVFTVNDQYSESD